MIMKWLCIGMLWLTFTASAVEIIESNEGCVNCHQQRDEKIVHNWQKSSHYQQHKVNCIHCHGTQHNQQMAAKARHNNICTQCHQGAESHSYARSKHGLIAQLEQRHWDWSKSLNQGNYRTPTCSYCHLHHNKHNPTITFDDSILPVCMNCHSTRYIQTLLKTNQNMLKIGKLKQQEAQQLITKYQQTLSKADLSVLEQHLKNLNQHLQHIQLGIGHQSPDDQWWYGHPAIDGDLIEVKSYISRVLRKQRIQRTK